MGCNSSKETETPKSAKGSSKSNTPLPPPTPITPVAKPTRNVLDYYTLGDVLGQGSYSVVKLGFDKQTGNKVAIKIVTRARLRGDDEEALIREVEILRKLDHPNIVKVLDFFEETAYYYVVLEYVSGGELFERLIEKAVYTENEARDIALIIFKAIKYCHDHHVVHRDIKPENILLASKDDDTNIKLCDFGFAATVGSAVLNKQAGTPGYVSPEVLERKPHGKPVDMWSMGVVLFMLLGGYPPFYEPDDNQKNMYRRILIAEYEFHPDYWSNVSDEAKDLIRKLLTVDPALRINVDQVLQHPWFNKPKESLALVSLGSNMAILRDFRANRKKIQREIAVIAIDTVRKLSAANLTRSNNINDVAIDVMRKLSGTNINEAVIQAARQRSAANIDIKRKGSTANTFNTSSNNQM